MFGPAFVLLLEKPLVILEDVVLLGFFLEGISIVLVRGA